MVCDVFGDESQLLLCDGCNHSCHVFCAGLDNIPAGAWFCYTCQEDAQIMHNNYQPRTIAHRAISRGARGRQIPDNQTTWARLWRSVASRTGIDLDHPFDEEEEITPQDRRRQRAQRQEFREWQRRFQVAGRVAGASAANRFRELAPPPQSARQPKPESQEEIRAWNAFEKARLIQADEHGRGRRKRRSRDSSPELEAPPVPERKRKRPRTLRIQDTDLTDSTVGESSRPARQERPLSISRPRPAVDDGTPGPTFLQSLLDEVESSTITHPQAQETYDTNGEYFPYGMDRGSSPEGSICASGPASPRAMTPPPPRPTSPTMLTTRIEPVFPPPPEFRPNSPTIEDSVGRARSRQRTHIARQSPGSSPVRKSSLPGPSASSPRTETASPKLAIATVVELPSAASSTESSSKAPLSLDLKTKTEIQALVKAALKPRYNANEINSQQYTEINRDVSRKLYDVIGTPDSFNESKEKWQSFAEQEVKNAVQNFNAADPPIDQERRGSDGVTKLAIRHSPLSENRDQSI
jgi:PHD finger protein